MSNATPPPSPDRGAARWKMRREPACDAGFRTYRYATDNPRQRVVDRFKLVRKMYDDCVLLQKGAGDGGWAIDFHTELDPPDAINLATMLEPLHPYFCEDLIRSEERGVLRDMRVSGLACRSQWASNSATSGTSTPLIEKQ